MRVRREEQFVFRSECFGCACQQSLGKGMPLSMSCRPGQIECQIPLRR
jgi:hypothetical protein